VAGFRYWRLVGIETWGRGALELSGVHLWDNGARVDAGASLSATHPPYSGATLNLQDSDGATLANWPRATYSIPRFALEWDFGADQSVDDVLFGAAGSQATYPMCAVLQGSADQANWTTLLSIDGIAYPGANTMQTYDAGGDHHWSNVALLMPFDGADGSQTFLDKSPLAKTISVAGNTKISTARSVFGGASGYFDGSGDYLQASSAGIVFGSQDWTMQFRYYNDNTVGANNGLMTIRDNFGDSGGWLIDTGLTAITWLGGPSLATGIAVSTPAATWGEYCFERCGNTLYAMKDGVVVGSTPITANLNHTGTFYIGRLAFQGAILKGNLDNLRFTVGTARYQGKSYTLPSAAHPERAKLTRTTPTGLWTRLHARGLAVSGGYGDESLARQLAGIARGYDSEGGRGVITGSTKVDSTPDAPIRRRVRLFRDRDGVFVAETWSNATTGAFAFTDLNPAMKYSAVAYDHENVFRAVIGDNLTPVIA
jgi:hypothetical protein